MATEITREQIFKWELDREIERLEETAKAVRDRALTVLYRIGEGETRFLNSLGELQGLGNQLDLQIGRVTMLHKLLETLQKMDEANAEDA
jgi:hypothetical protein